MEVWEGSHGYCVTGIAWNPKLPTPTPDHLPQHPSPPFSPQTCGNCVCFYVKQPTDNQNLLCTIRDDIWKISEAWNLMGGKKSDHYLNVLMQGLSVPVKPWHCPKCLHQVTFTVWSPFSRLKKKLLLCLFIYRRGHVHSVCGCGGQKTACKSVFWPSSRWDVGIGLMCQAWWQAPFPCSVIWAGPSL